MSIVSGIDTVCRHWFGIFSFKKIVAQRKLVLKDTYSLQPHALALCRRLLYP